MGFLQAGPQCGPILLCQTWVSPAQNPGARRSLKPLSDGELVSPKEILPEQLGSTEDTAG